MIIHFDKHMWIIFFVLLLGLLMFVRSGAYDKTVSVASAYLESDQK